MIIYLHGPDTFRSRRQMRDMIAKFKKDRDPQGLNVVRLDVEKQADKVMQEVLGVPFLAERKMIVLENLLASKNKELITQLHERIDGVGLPASNVVLFWEGTSKFKIKLAKEFAARLEKEKFAQSFEELEGPKMASWIVAEVKNRGGSINRQAASYIVQHVGNNLWRVSSLIDQLVAFVSENPSPTLPYEGREITLQDAMFFLDERADDNIFNLVDAIVAKQPKKVFKMIRQQYDNGEDAFYLFAMITRQFRILMQMRDLIEREGEARSADMAEKLDLHPFVVKKSLPLVKRYTMETLESIYQELLEFDKGTKTGQGDPRMMLDMLVGRVATN